MIPWVSVFIVTDSYLKGTNQSITLSTQISGTVKGEANNCRHAGEVCLYTATDIWRQQSITLHSLRLQEKVKDWSPTVGRYGGLFIPDQRQRGGEKGDLPHSKDRTNHCRDKGEFVYWHTPNTAFRHGWHRRVGTAYHWPWFISGWACSSNLQSLT